MSTRCRAPFFLYFSTTNAFIVFLQSDYLRQSELFSQNLVEERPWKEAPAECDLTCDFSGWVAQKRSLIERCLHDGFGYSFSSVRSGHRMLKRDEIFCAARIIDRERFVGL